MKRGSANLKAALCLAAAWASTGWAGERWVETRADGETAFGDSVSLPRYRELVRATALAEAALQKDAVLNRIPEVRLQANRDIGYPEVEGGNVAAYLWIGLHKPGVWQGSRGIDQEVADYELDASARIEFNAPVSFVSALGHSYDPENPAVFGLTEETIAQFNETGVVVSDGTAVRAIRMDGQPVLRPYTVGEHLDQWETKLELMIQQGGGAYAREELSSLREYRDSLDSDELGRQAALSSEAYSSHIWGVAQVGSDGALPMYCVPADLFQGDGSVGRVRMVALSYSVSNPEDPTRLALADWIRDFDLESFVSSLRDR